MSGSKMLIGALVYFILGYFLYGKFLKKRFGIDPGKKTPAETMADGVDYCSAPAPVLFGHHFASIAGAGPIVGPILAALYGWLPAILWILIGCVFIGGVHDFSALFLSVRNKGKTIAFIIEQEIGYWGRQVFLLFVSFALILVVAVFTLMVAQGFMDNPAVATSSILFIFMAPLFGIITNKKILSLLEATIIFVPLLFICVWLGTVIPLDLTAITGSAKKAVNLWYIFILYYAVIASIIPVWILLQPRDYLNSYLLYVMMFLGIFCILGAHPTIDLPAVTPTIKGNMVPGIFPLLFVTIACGACSGFHSLVSSGTTSKQINGEQNILPIGYGAMLVEGLLAVISIVSVAYLGHKDLAALLTGANKVAPATAFAQGLAHFGKIVGFNEPLVYNFICLAVSAFLLTSLDTATRLARFTVQELVQPSAAPGIENQNVASKQCCVAKGCPILWGIQAFFGNRWGATLTIAICGWLLCITGEGMTIWPIFGSANQLLAALTFLTVTLWLIRNKKPALFALLPLAFMMLISIWALVSLIIDNIGKNTTLVVFGVILVALSLVLVGMGIRVVCKEWKKQEK